MRTCAQLRHRPQVSFLRGRKPIEPDKEETLVKVCYGLSGSRGKTRLCNRRILGYVPNMLVLFAPVVMLGGAKYIRGRRRKDQII